LVTKSPAVLAGEARGPRCRFVRGFRGQRLHGFIPGKKVDVGKLIGRSPDLKPLPAKIKVSGMQKRLSSFSRSAPGHNENKRLPISQCISFLFFRAYFPEHRSCTGHGRLQIIFAFPSKTLSQGGFQGLKSIDQSYLFDQEIPWGKNGFPCRRSIQAIHCFRRQFLHL